jgi:hypothetical protein
MKRLAVSLVATAVLVGAIGAFGRAPAHDAPAASAPAPWARDAEHAGSFSSRSLCTIQASVPVQTANVNTIVDDALTAGGDEAGCLTPQDEPMVAVNPVDPQNVVAGANDFRTCCDANGDNNSTGWAYVSRDGGATWTNVHLPGLTRQTGATGTFVRFDVAEDPALAFAPDGTLYYAHIVFATGSPASGIAVSVSRDGGATWGTPKLVQYTSEPTLFNDKEWIAVGSDGRAVVTWTRFRNQDHAVDSIIQGSFSSDGGETWTKPMQLSNDRHRRSQGSMPVWRKDGTLNVVFATTAPPHFKGAVALSTLAPGGRVVQRDIARIYDDANCFAVNGNMRQTLTDEAFRVSSLPSVSIDPTTQAIAIAWVDGERGCAKGRVTRATNAQVKLVTVRGSTVSKPRIITSGADKALPTVAARDGKVLVAYYTRSFAPATCLYAAKRVCLDFAYSSSVDGFATERRLSDGSSNPFVQFEGMFIGDYAGLAVGADGVAHAVWTDTRTGDQNIYAQAFSP